MSEPFESLLASASPGIQAIARALRAGIASLDPYRVEQVWKAMRIASYGVGPHKMTQHYAYIGVHAAHVNVGFYRGALLDDPRGLLEGTGKALRHVKVRTPGEAANPALRALLRRAIEERAPARSASRGVTRSRSSSRARASAP